MGNSQPFNATFKCITRGEMTNLLGLSPVSYFIQNITTNLNLTNQAFTLYLGDKTGKLTVG